MTEKVKPIMKVALVHDYIKEYGGAERVLEALHEVFPNAPVYTSVYLPKFLGPHRERFRNWDIRTSWLQYMPINYKLISPFRLISPFIFKQFDLSEYDVVIVSATGAYFPNTVKTKRSIARSDLSAVRQTIHICYCHTPPRYLYGYATARDWKKNKVFAILGAVANHFLRIVDFNASKNVDYYIANSQEVAARIKKFYRRESVVIYPPVDGAFSPQRLGTRSRKKTSTKPYFLTGGRLARAKHVDLIIQACREMNIPLKVFGRGFAGYEENIKSQISKVKSWKCEFLGAVTDEEKFRLMRDAKAFLFAAEDEDSGITPVEAMAVGTPVIAYRSGGIVEKIIEGKTGLFFDELTISCLQKAIKRFQTMKFDPKDCVLQAQRFSKKKFISEIVRFVNVCYHSNTDIGYNKYSL